MSDYTSANGEIRLMLGDCLERMGEIADGSVDLILADPPYGIDYQSNWRTDKTAWTPKIANDKEPFISWLPEAYRVTADPGALICFCVWEVQEAFKTAIAAAGFSVRSQVIWDRDAHGMGDLGGAFGPQHDVAWFAVKGDYKFPGKRPKSVLRHPRVPASSLLHPNQKPVALLADLINSLCARGGVALDPFAGSGSSLVAAQKTGRRAVGIELDPKHVGIAVRRIREAETPLFAGLEASA